MPASKNEFKEWIVNLRNDFHKHPEVSGNEKRTTQQICEVLKTLDAQIQTFADMTGAVAVLKGEKQDLKKNRIIALRADIDALPDVLNARKNVLRLRLNLLLNQAGLWSVIIQPIFLNLK